jgi:hypothetical protein
MAEADASVHKGQCFCGAVHVEATGAPFVMGYCHCKDCRAWAAAPVNGFTLWTRDAVKVTKGADKLGSFNKTGRTDRKYCTACGGHVLSDHPEPGFTDIFAAVIPAFDFRPALHVNYESSVMRVKDGLPKYKDFPKDFGGSGEELPE